MIDLSGIFSFVDICFNPGKFAYFGGSFIVLSRAVSQVGGYQGSGWGVAESRSISSLTILSILYHLICFKDHAKIFL